MKNVKFISLLSVSILSFCSSISLCLSSSILNPDYERTCYQNGSLFARSNNPIQTVSFQYSPNQPVSIDKYKEVNDLVNSIDGGSKYYNYACLWGETDEYDVLGSKIKLADISYNEENPIFSTNFLELTYPTNYAQAFKNDSPFNFLYDFIEIPLDCEFQLDCFLNSNHIENNSIFFAYDTSGKISVSNTGVLKGLHPGHVTLEARFADYSSFVDVSILPEKSGSVKTYNYAKAIVPICLLQKIGFSDYFSSIGSILQVNSAENKFFLKVCGVYQAASKNIRYKNNFYSQNYSDYIYFLRDSKCYIPIQRYCLTIGTEDKINMNLYSDMQVFKKMTNSVFSIPTEKEINSHSIEIEGKTLTINEISSVLDESNFISLSFILLLCGVSFMMVLLYMLVSKKMYKNNNVLLTIYISGILLPALFLKLCKKISIYGVGISPVSVSFGWILILFTVAFGLFLSFNLIKASNINEKEISISEGKYIEISI